MKFLKLSSLVVFLIVVAACSKSGEEDTEHFASSQQRALEKAKGVEDMLMDSEKERRKKAESTE